MADAGHIGGSRPPISISPSPGSSSTTPPAGPVVKPPDVPPPVVPPPTLPDVPTPGRGRPTHVVEVVESDGFVPDQGGPKDVPAESPDRFAPDLPRNDRPSLEVPAPARPREVQEVLPDLRKVEQPEQVPERLVTDLSLVKDQLTDGRGSTRADAAQKLVGFAAEYVERFIALAPPLSHEAGDQNPKQQQQGDGKGGLKSETKQALANARLDQGLDQALSKAGLHEVVDVATGQSAKELLLAAASSRAPDSARAVADERRFDAPAWPLKAAELPVPQAAPRPDQRPDAERDARAVQLHTQVPGVDMASKRAQLGLMTEGRPLDGRATFEEILETQRSHRSRDGKLGSQMLWNFLHRMRGAELEDEEARKEAQARIAIAGAAIVLALGVAVVAMLSM
ncbi:MAG: hypothetical protein K1X89_31175 [Myxococcaceae bacterium]|nr:hypothetical protein [Myxococcaceae bacterium]